MGWSEWPYWLRGGIIAVLISLMNFLVFSFVKDLEIHTPIILILTHIIALISAPFYWGGWFFVWGDNGPPIIISNEWIQLILGWIIIFIIGSIIGWMYGKIKQK